MIVEIFFDGITKKDAKNFPVQEACRGILKKDQKYLMVHLTKYDIYNFPGGRMEPNEDKIECVKREVLEETGVVIKNPEFRVTVKEYTMDHQFHNHFFVCEYDYELQQNLTEEEVELKLEVKWLTTEELMHELTENDTLHEFGPHIHNREFMGFINSI